MDQGNTAVQEKQSKLIDTEALDKKLLPILANVQTMESNPLSVFDNNSFELAVVRIRTCKNLQDDIKSAKKENLEALEKEFKKINNRIKTTLVDKIEAIDSTYRDSCKGYLELLSESDDKPTSGILKQTGKRKVTVDDLDAFWKYVIQNKKLRYLMIPDESALNSLANAMGDAFIIPGCSVENPTIFSLTKE